MGRAQVSQAEACKIDPIADMNPILLKPNGNNKSQVIVRGKVVGDMSSKEYHDYKLQLTEVLDEIFKEFEEKYDVVVMEGAGSCAEINLMERDISNMGMAKIADAPVILVGDIDRGGVFASLAGTMLLLPEEYKKRVKGVIINKFRGRKELLEEGIKMLEEIINVPVLGVIPYSDIKIEDEDSVTTRFKAVQGKRDIHIEIIRTPHMSNFTDFNPFENIPGVSLRYVKHIHELKHPDMVILPGTKNTMGDLQWMRESGMEAAVLKPAAAGTVIFGVCGGYQMLGETLSDPDGVEAGGTMKGMGLLPMDTVFADGKTRTRVSGIFGQVEGELSQLSGVELEGYEIHMGVTTLHEGASPLTTIRDHAKTTEEKQDGAYTSRVYGTYVHGVFDKEGVAEAVIRALGKKKGIDTSEMKGVDFRTFKETQYDILAAALREHLDMKAIYEILEAGV